jgi:hypothetical protein
MKHYRANQAFKRNTLRVVRGNVMHGFLASIFALGFFLATTLTSAGGKPAHPFPASDAATKPPAIVIGFVGGFIAHDNPVHSEVQLAARLRKEYPAGVDVETFESYRSERAYRKVLSLLDTNHEGTVTAAEKENARIIIYGHSWGGSEAIVLARALAKDGIPVVLTVQVDSVSRFGSNDTTIPANVAQAANFYQPHGIVHGDHDIRPADAARTRILGNFRFDYSNSTLTCVKYPWYDRIFVKSHTQIECDPMIWDQVESLIRANLPAVTAHESAQ